VELHACPGRRTRSGARAFFLLPDSLRGVILTVAVVGLTLADLPARAAPGSQANPPAALATSIDSTRAPERWPSFWPGVVDTVEVRAARPSEREILARRSGFATFIPLGPEAPADRDLADLLDRTAGVHVHRYGGLGAFALASVRGSTPGQVEICLDGVPLSDAGDGFINLALLPTACLEHAEVYRGAETVAFGGPPAAGVINLVSPPAAPVPLRISLGLGSFGTALGRGQWGGALAGVNGLISGQYRRSRGDYPYLDRNGTDYQNTSDDRIVRRTNDDFAETSLLGKLARVVPGGGRLEYTGQLYTRESGIPGTEDVQTLHVRFRTDRWHQELLARLPAAAWRPALEASLHTESVRDRLDNREGEVGLGRVQTDDRTREYGGRLAGTVALPAQELRLGLERRDERWTPRDVLAEATGYTRTRRHQTESAEDRLALGRLSLEGSYRWAAATDNYGGSGPGNAAPTSARTLHSDSPTFGARFDLGNGFVLKANHGRMVRFPSFPELFGQNGVQEGNPGLVPEHGVQWDAGLAASPHSPFRLEVALFERTIEDEIALIQNSQRTTRAENLDRSWIRGLETSAYLSADLPHRLRYEGELSHTWQAATDIGASPTYRGKDLPDLPRSEGYLSQQISWEPWKLRWEISVRSSAFRDRYNSPSERTPAYAVHDLSLERSLDHDALRLRLEVRNLGNVQIEDIDGFPLPGRSFLTEVTWTR